MVAGVGEFRAREIRTGIESGMDQVGGKIRNIEHISYFSFYARGNWEQMNKKGPFGPY